MFKRSKIYYRIGEDGQEHRVRSDAKVLPNDFFEGDEHGKNDHGEKGSFAEFFSLAIAPRLAVIADVVVDFAAFAGIFFLLFNGIGRIIDKNGTDC